MNFRSYPRYKASGIDWLGDVPEHWLIKRLKSVALRIDEKAEPEEEYPLPYIGLEHIEPWTGRLFAADQDDQEVGISNRFTDRDTLFGKLRPYLAKGYNADFDGICSSELLVLRPIGLERRFLLYTLLLEGFVSLVDSSAYGAKMPRASWAFVGTCPVPIPPAPEQGLIADHLDRQTAKVDGLTTKKRILIEKLREKRSALISQTVTRCLPPDAARAAGLNPHPKLKPSGVDWIGDIPEHWDVVPLARIVEEIQTGPFGSQLHQQDYVDSGIPLVNPIHIQADGIVPDDEDTVTPDTAARLARYRLRLGDIVFARRGDMGRCALVDEGQAGWLCGTGSMVIRLTAHSGRYFVRVFRSSGFIDLLALNAVGTTMPNLSPAILRRMMVPLPPTFEQELIGAFVDTQTANIDRMVDKIEEAIARLQAYRSALIAAAVTGKIDVRGTVAAEELAVLAAEG